MNTITRIVQKNIESDFFKGKAIVIYGARQVGKTTLVKQLMANFKDKSVYFNCDEPDLRTGLTDKTSSELKLLIGDAKMVVFDEAQRIENIGMTLKLLVDTYPDIQIIATGSSSFELANTISEPLTGRTFQYILFPISEMEIVSHSSPLEVQRTLESRLKYGNYPEIYKQVDQKEKERLLNSIKANYLLADILKLENIKGSDTLYKLLQLLALQVGSEVSFSELASTLEIDKNTVKKYIDLLQKTFIVFRLNALSRNSRKEITKKVKIYFNDVGIRNALINNFNDMDIRLDKGALWENYLVSERMKFNSYTRNFVNSYFWRTYDQKELDLVEEENGKFCGYEFKWGGGGSRVYKLFKELYPDSCLRVVNRENYLSFLS